MTRFVLKGVETEFFRLQGDPHLNFTKDGKEWSSNFFLTDEHLKICRDNGMAKAYVKTTKKENGETVETPPYLKFVKKATTRDGRETKPIPVVDRFGQPWDPNVNVGNGSKVDLIIMLNEVTMGVNTGKLKPYVAKVAVKDHVPYIPDDGIEYDVADDNGPSEEFNDSVEDIAAADTDW